MLGKTGEARELLSRALRDARADGFVMPFAENYGYLETMLREEIQDEFIRRIIELGEGAKQRRTETVRPRELAVLTERECGIVDLLTQRLSNREIAERLFLSEGSVKQYVSRIYSKLHIQGDTRTKRQQLCRLLRGKS